MLTRAFEVYDSKNENFIGHLLLTIKEKVEVSVTYKDSYLEINSYFYEDLKAPSLKNFYASYRVSLINENDQNYANISYLNPPEGGDIILFDGMRGFRIGSLIMYIKIQWLKNLSADYKVKGIFFRPDGDPEIAKQFYKNFGVRIDGLPFKISNLYLHDTWKKNIFEIDLNKIDSIIQNLVTELNFINSKIKYLKEMNFESNDKYSKINILNFWICRNFYADLSNCPMSFDYTNLSKFDLEAKTELLSKYYHEKIAINQILEVKKKEHQKQIKRWDFFHIPHRFLQAIINIFNMLLRYTILLVFLYLIYKYLF
ncbi:hypothetical protein [Acinetobacter bereziniae]|uniref:hypothetical protein n=1 Tax=Acinetobacter bereziniae TaxID=106648 RepID=UPI0030161DEA